MSRPEKLLKSLRARWVVMPAPKKTPSWKNWPWLVVKETMQRLTWQPLLPWRLRRKRKNEMLSRTCRRRCPCQLLDRYTGQSHCYILRHHEGLDTTSILGCKPYKPLHLCLPHRLDSRHCQPQPGRQIRGRFQGRWIRMEPQPPAAPSIAISMACLVAFPIRLWGELPCIWT